ncbi:unnamed protein product [Closterium sp. Yama58-4]|nr:unnamed protein product [Closterium sp. Yama58-4]
MDEENLGWRSHWGFKLIVAATIVGVAINAFPLMGDSLIRHSVALLRAKDPFLRRSGAYRLAFIASNDETRMKIVEAGALPHLLLLLESPFHRTEATPHPTSPPLASAPLAPVSLAPPPLSPSERRMVKEALTCLTHLARSDTAVLAMVAAGVVARLQQAAVCIRLQEGDQPDELLGPLNALVSRLVSAGATTQNVLG